MKKVIFLLIAAASILAGCKQTSDGGVNLYSIIPAPSSLVEMNGRFIFSSKSQIILTEQNDETMLAADFLALLIKNPTGISIPVVEGNNSKSGDVFMALDTSVNNNEGYILSVTKRKIIIKAKTPVGLFYAVQTLRQLMPVEVEKDGLVEGMEVSVPSCEIEDEPEYVYRGMHLDVGRHMFPVAFIKKYIDMISMHKMNTFHWHLTEDQGWRIEIKKYPRLTETGGFRKETLVGHGGTKPYQYDGTPYGGFYTQDEIRDVVSYAKSRFVTIIPEIEMPGHAQAALAAYPELSCTGGPFEVHTRWGVVDNVFCAGKEETFNFLQDVLTEVIDLFPGTYIHVGGDECPKTKWEECPDCQKRIKAESLKNEEELQSYFIRRMEKFLASKSRKLIGWDEILEGGIAPEATVMSWRGTEGGIDAARQKHDVIMTPSKFVYLDYYQTVPEGQPLAIGGYLPLELVYSYNPMPEELSDEEQKHILGVQGNVWTEYIRTSDHVEYMAYPRMFALAETGWTSDKLKDFEDFLSRLEIMKRRYDLIGLNYFKGEYRDTKGVIQR